MFYWYFKLGNRYLFSKFTHKASQNSVDHCFMDFRMTLVSHQAPRPTCCGLVYQKLKLIEVRILAVFE